MGALLLLATLLLPVPWMHLVSEDPPGTAWRLDGRLEIEGATIDPPGRWSWLAVGRPPLVVEVLRDRLVGTDRPAVDLRSGPVVRRPALNEPAAVAVGLLHAGRDIDLGVLVEVRQPLLEGYPEKGVLAAVEGVPVTDAWEWDRISRTWEPPSDTGGDPPPRPAAGDPLTFRFRSGQRFTAPGPGLPYRQVTVLPTAPRGLQARITLGLSRFLPEDWFRNLSLGRSHGAMVALMTYAHASGEDLAQERHVAGTGGVLADGTITPIGGLVAKARAAHRAGADVLLVPASQAQLLDGVPLTGTTVVPVSSLTEAIEWLRAPVT